MDQVHKTTNVPQTQLCMALIQIMEQQLCLNGINSWLQAILYVLLLQKLLLNVILESNFIGKVKNIETLWMDSKGLLIFMIQESSYKSAVICAIESVTDRQTEGRIATILLAIPKTSHSLQLEVSEF